MGSALTRASDLTLEQRWPCLLGFKEMPPKEAFQMTLELDIEVGHSDPLTAVGSQEGSTLQAH